MFDIKKLMECSPQEFEELCCAYTQAKYGDYANVKLTPPQGDGGKDIEIILIPSNKVHWGECKLHNRNIDLSSIGKNIVLVQARKIKKIIFFSTNDIVYNTKKHIIEVARSHKFDAVFLDNTNLFSELAEFKIIENYHNEIKPFKVEFFAEEFSQSENAINYKHLSKESTFTLNASNRFSFLLLLENRSFSSFSAKISVDNDDKRFKIKIPKSKIKILPYSDVFAEIDVEVNIKFGDSIKFPSIKISTGKNINIYDLGEVKGNFYHEVPLVGQHNINAISAIHEGFLNNAFNVAEISGKKGMGKGRIIKEILQRFKDAKIFSIYPHNAAVPILSMISFILNLPLSDTDKMKDEIFKAVLRSKNYNDNEIYIISKYYYSPDALASDEFNALFNIIIEQLVEKSKKELIVISCDRITELATDSVRFLTDLIKNISEKKSRVKLIIALDREDKTNRNEQSEIFKNLLSTLVREKKCFAYKCKELDDVDKLLYCLEILGKDEERCAKLIIERYPGIPAVLSDICNGLLPLDREDRILKLSKSINAEKTREELIVNLFTDQGGKYGEYIKTFCKWLILFQNNLPAGFINVDQNDVYLQKMIQERLIKYNIENDTYSFYQKYSFSILSNHFRELENEAANILSWLDKNCVDNLLVRFLCFIASNQTNKAFECGFSAVENSNIDVNVRKKIAETLYNLSINTHDKLVLYKLIKALAHFYLFNNNFKEGVRFFKKAYSLSLNKNLKIEKTESYHIRHEYINSLIHCGKYSEALSILKGICEDSIESMKHRFLLHNRLGVTNTFLYNIDIAENDLQTAMKLAATIGDKFFISTIYSDIAFLYLKTNQKEKAALYFNKAFSEYAACGYTELYRDIEINEQKAIALALKNKQHRAMLYINRALDICERNYSNFSLIKANFVKAYINICSGNLECAEKIYNECITLAKIFGNDVQLIYANAGLAALNMLKNNSNQVIKIFKKLMRQLKNFEGIGAKLAILKNFAFFFYSNNDTENLSTLHSLNMSQLNDYINKLKRYKYLSKSTVCELAQNAANFNGLSFLY